MSYEFYCDPATGSDDNSGSSTSAVAWTGTVTCAGNTSVTNTGGGDWSTSGWVGKFIRIDPGGANDTNLRIVLVVSATQMVVAEDGPTVTDATANIDGPFATLQGMEDNVPAYNASGRTGRLYWQ